MLMENNGQNNKSVIHFIKRAFQLTILRFYNYFQPKIKSHQPISNPMNPNLLSNSQSHKSTSKNHNFCHQNSFKQFNLIFRNRNRFMSSDSIILLQTGQVESSDLLLHQTYQNYQNFHSQRQNINHNPQNDFLRNRQKQDHNNSFGTNQSSNKTPQNHRRRNHALRKQVIDSSLGKLRKNLRKSFLQRLNDFRLTQNSTFSRISWEEYQSGQWKISPQLNKIDIISESQRNQSYFKVASGNIKNLQNQVQNQNGQLNKVNTLNSNFLDCDSLEEKQQQEMIQKNSIQSQEQYQSQIEWFPQEGTLVIPQRKVQDFVPFIQMENKLHDDFYFGVYQRNPNQNYQSRYEIYYPKNPNFPGISTQAFTKKIRGFKIISINCGKNLNNLNRKIKKKSYKTKQDEDMRQMILVILNYMTESYDFILLQQACDPVFQQHLLQAIIEFNRLKGDIYFFPQHLPRKVNGLRTTTMLTKHQVKMGQFNFILPDFHSRLPTQTYCEFRIKINQQWENVCIFCCHLKSSKGHKVQLFSQIRMQQVDAIQNFGKKYDRFICIGDTNIPSSFAFALQNNYVSSKFFDAINYGISEYRGTYLFKNPKGRVVQERIDRVWLDRKSALTTSVLINYHDILLEACEDLYLDQINMIQKAADGVHPYITVTDHTILDIEIMFTK